jgi:hypothetical protein
MLSKNAATCDIHHKKIGCEERHLRAKCLARTVLTIVTTFGVTMDFEWDEAKNRVNVRKHGFNFADAEEMFRGFLFVPTFARTTMRSDGLVLG